MTLLAYLLCISRADNAAALHQLRREIAVDPELTEAGRQSLANSIDRRFSAINAASLPNPQPRWS